MTDRVWRSGPAPHIGWWNASNTRDPSVWRWWDGKIWSEDSGNGFSPGFAARLAAQPASAIHRNFEWTDYWPETRKEFNRWNGGPLNCKEWAKLVDLSAELGVTCVFPGWPGSLPIRPSDPITLHDLQNDRMEYASRDGQRWQPDLPQDRLISQLQNELACRRVSCNAMDEELTRLRGVIKEYRSYVSKTRNYMRYEFDTLEKNLKELYNETL